MALERVRDLMAGVTGGSRPSTKEAADRDEFLQDALSRFRQVLRVAEEAILLLDGGVDDFSLSLTDDQKSSTGSFQITLRVTGQGSSRRADFAVSSLVREAELGDNADHAAGGVIA